MSRNFFTKFLQQFFIYEDRPTDTDQHDKEEPYPTTMWRPASRVGANCSKIGSSSNTETESIYGIKQFTDVTIVQIPNAGLVDIYCALHYKKEHPRYFYMHDHRQYIFKTNELEHFLDWYDEYSKKYSNEEIMIHSYFPPPSDDIYPYSVKTNINNNLIDEWVWLSENCEDEFRYASEFFFFKSITDKTIYSLRK